MPLLIDGYNLLHATDIFGDGPGAGSFQRSREALLTFLTTSLTEAERKGSSIVFDAADAPPGLPNHYQVEGLTVIFARDFPDADALIEEMLEDHRAPRSLLVVSSDHRVQRAARRRGAKHTDSERWYAELWQRRIDLRRQQQKAIPEKPVRQLSAAEIAYWVQEFETGEAVPELPPPAKEANDQPTQRYENPFPPGYGEDLLSDSD